MNNSVLSEQFEEIIWPIYLTRSKATKKTISNLHQYLEKLVTITGKSVTDMTEQDIRAFMDSLYLSVRKGEYQASYVKVIYLSVRKFYDFLLNYRYELKDKGIEVMGTNPFKGVPLNIEEKKLLTAQDLPNLEALDTLVNASREENPSLYLAVCFAAKMGLSISEISNLRTSALGYMKEEILFEKQDGTHDQNLYLCIEDQKKSKKIKRYLMVPEDLKETLEEILYTEKNEETQGDEETEETEVDVWKTDDYRNPESSSYLISYKGKHYSERTMQYHLKKLCEEKGMKPVTFADLRNLAIFLMKEGGAKDSQIAKYMGLEGRWLCRFAGIDSKQVFGTADFNRIQIKTKEY